MNADPPEKGLISPHDVADVLTEVVGRKVKYKDAPPKMLLKAATAQGLKTFEIA